MSLAGLEVPTGQGHGHNLPRQVQGAVVTPSALLGGFIHMPWDKSLGDGWRFALGPGWHSGYELMAVFGGEGDGPLQPRAVGGRRVRGQPLSCSD